MKETFLRYKEYNIIGYHNGFFNKKGEENKQIIEKINNLDTDILFVGLGNPLQEN